MVRFGLAALLISATARSIIAMGARLPGQVGTRSACDALSRAGENPTMVQRTLGTALLVVHRQRSRRQFVETIKSAVDDRDAKQIFAVLNPLPPGRYLIKFRVLSVDGHVVEDQFPFTIKQ